MRDVVYAAADLDAITSIDRKGVAAFADCDYEKFAETFTEDCTIIAPGSTPRKGRAGENRTLLLLLLLFI